LAHLHERAERQEIGTGRRQDAESCAMTQEILLMETDERMAFKPGSILSIGVGKIIS